MTNLHKYIELYDSGLKPIEIAKRLNIDNSTVARQLRNKNTTPETSSLHHIKSVVKKA